MVAPSPRRTEAQGQQQTASVFPTDSKEREKQKDAKNKEKGIEKVVKRKPKIIERHYDDCGDDLSFLDTPEPQEKMLLPVPNIDSTYCNPTGMEGTGAAGRG